MAMPKGGKSAVNWILLGFILLGLGGWGVRSFSGPGGGTIGSVGKVGIGANDYARALRSEMENVQAQTGQPVNAAAARAMGLMPAVQQRLITAAALEAEAQDIGLSVGDERVAKQIAAAPGFGGPGGFDRARYQETLRRQGLTADRFEHDVRMDEARLIQQRAVAGSTVAPAGAAAETTRWLTQTRDLGWAEITPAALPAPVAAPDEAALKAWHQANAARFTAPETRRIRYAWLTPDMLEGKVQLDEAALRAAYDQRKAEFQQPERRMVDRLVYPDMASAEAAKARLDKGEASFDTLVAERGLDRASIDLGEVSEAALGAAGAAVFAPQQNGVVGPVQTDLGPALFSVNAILDPVNVSFEEARDDLRGEAAADKARRDIEEQSGAISDLLAGGATLDDLAKETPMQVGTIDWQAATTPAAGSIATYPAFRSAAAALKQGDYPVLTPLDDGGIFAAVLEGVTPPALIPFEQVKDKVLADWTAAETQRRMLELAEQQRLAAASGTPVPGMQTAAALGRDGAIDNVPAEVVARGFALAEAGDSAVVDADGRVFVVTLEAVHDADPKAPQVQEVATAVQKRLSQTLAEDYFDYYARALIAGHGLKLDQSAIAGIEARVQ